MEILIVLVKCIVIFGIAMNLASLCTWIERKGSALIQDRIGANRAGAYFETDFLLLKPVFWAVRMMGALGIINTLLCDAVKALMKEDFIPEGTSNFMHSLAPFMAVFPIFLAYALIPFSPDFEVAGYYIRTQVAPLNSGVLFILAMGSIAVYGVIIAGWTGNNKFALLGALRASAQMMSYELALGISFATLIVYYGTLDLYQMVDAQRSIWGIFHPVNWITFIVLFVAGMAETKRGPFDLPESESELVAGYFTEYSGMKFLLFWLGEFAEIALFALLIVLLFFGGWHLWIQFPELSWWGALIGHGIFMGKVIFFCLLQIVIRWTLPRFRYDQLMNLGWKMLLPLSLVNLMVTAALKVAGYI